MNIPIYRAKKIGSDKYITGFYILNTSTGVHKILTQQEGWISEAIAYQTERIIDPSTLEISFNNGEKWFTLDRVKTIMDKQVNCTICNDTGVNHHNQPRPGKWKSIPCECGAKK